MLATGKDILIRKREKQGRKRQQHLRLQQTKIQKKSAQKRDRQQKKGTCRLFGRKRVNNGGTR